MSTSSQGDTPASLSVSQDSEMANPTNDTSGPTFSTPFAEYDPDTHCWRMYPVISLWGSEEFSQTWPESGMTASGIAYRLPVSGPHINANDSLRLPTIRATAYKHAKYWIRRNGEIRSNFESAIPDMYPDTLGQPVNLHLLEWMMGFPIGWTEVKDSETQ